MGAKSRIDGAPRPRPGVPIIIVMIREFELSYCRVLYRRDGFGNRCCAGIGNLNHDCNDSVAGNFAQPYGCSLRTCNPWTSDGGSERTSVHLLAARWGRNLCRCGMEAPC